MKEKKLTFKKFYVCYLIILIVAVAAAVFYVNGLLQQYEDLRPEKKVQEGIDWLAKEAKEADFWNKYSLPEMEAGEYEAHMDVQSKYLELLTDGNAAFTSKNGSHEEDELFYVVENDGVNLAEIKLKATGPVVTKLTILNMREWELVSVNPMVETRDYTISVPNDFQVAVNDVTLLPEDGINGKDSEITYTVSDVYLEPEFDITDKDGNKVNYTVKNNRVMAEFYDYSLTLPTMLTVTLNGEICQGQSAGNGRVHYDIRLLEKPELIISDYFGNTMEYEGGDEIPLTYMTITADSRYNVTVSGQPVPAEIVTTSANKAYEQFKDYVKDLPEVSVYEIAVLNKDVKVAVTDENGNPVTLEPGKTTYDFTMGRNALEEVPDNVSSEIDVLDIARKWSLFMSNDLAFAKVKQYLIADSYQYEVAVQYATGEDITFTSAHTLGNPPFTQEEVTNFVWITDDCFSVDISFVKHMILKTGTRVDDYMNDRFYFVKYDDTEDDTDNPTWKIASMKEIVNNEQ